MRKNIIIAALFAATSITPLAAQDMPDGRRGRMQTGPREVTVQPSAPAQGQPDAPRGQWQRNGGQGGWQGSGWQGRQRAEVQPQQAIPQAPIQQSAPVQQGERRDWGGGFRQNGQRIDVRNDAERQQRWQQRQQQTQPNQGWQQRQQQARQNQQWRNRDYGFENRRFEERRDEQRQVENRGFANRGYAWRGDQNRDWNNRGFDNRGQSGNWNRDWRRDQRYDWQRYRSVNRDFYRGGRYYAPYGWSYGYRRFSIGISLSNVLFDQRYWIEDPYAYRLPPAYGAYRWVRYYDDVLLVDLRSGQVVDAIYDFFW